MNIFILMHSSTDPLKRLKNTTATYRVKKRIIMFYDKNIEIKMHGN